MPPITQIKLEIPKTQTAWAVLYCRARSYSSFRVS